MNIFRNRNLRKKSQSFATKADLKNSTEIDTSSFAKKVGLANLKSNVDNLDTDKLKKCTN